MTSVEPARRGAGAAAAGLLGPPAAALGQVLSVPLGALAALRGGKPMHPCGVVLGGTLEFTGAASPWGVPWLDEPRSEQVLVRLSRGAGLPERLPDLLGLAVHVPSDDVDLLFSSTGTGRVTRLLPVARRDAATTYGSIMGYRSAAGTLRLAAVGERTAGGGTDGAASGLVLVLAAASGSAPWRSFARLVCGDPVAGDPDVRFDAVRRPPPGLLPDGPLARLRAPSYRRARVGRDADGSGSL